MNHIDPRIIEQFNARAPFKLSADTLLILARVGSHSHNTYIPPDDPNSISDTDYMGVVIPPMNYTLGLREWDQMQFIHEDVDCTFYSFKKFVSLLVKSNPNVIGLLWQREEDYVYSGLAWTTFRSQRNKFSSLKAYPSFMGYANSQLQKMESYDLPTRTAWDEAVAIVETVGFTKEQVLARHQLNMPDFSKLNVPNPKDVLSNAFYTLQTIHGRHFQGYMGEKRKNLVRKYGYDTKNAAHLIRLMRMCVGFLHTGELEVFRSDGESIKAIKRGERTLADIKEEAADLFAAARIVKESSKLPPEPDFDFIDDLVVRVYIGYYAGALI